jgi:hypothetical protein
VATELTRVRANPAAYAVHLKALLAYFDGTILRLPGQTALQTQEGAPAVEEAIAALEAQAPVPAQTRQPDLDRAARDLVADQAKSGAYGHTGGDGSQPGDRMKRYVGLLGLAAETITYGPETVRRIVVGLLVHDGMPSQGHRRNVLQSRLALVGIAVGRHASGRWMCVMDDAERVKEPAKTSAADDP